MGEIGQPWQIKECKPALLELCTTPSINYAVVNWLVLNG
jgi:hypothetical protein